MAIVESKVKPERMAQNDRGAKDKWWQFIRPRPELHAAIAGLNRVLVTPRTSKQIAFIFLDSGMVYSENLVVFTFDTYHAVAVLQSNIHDLWVRFTSSTLEDRIGYRPSDCFETFPFPVNWITTASLESTGQQYYQYRAELMIRKGEGLTNIYNRFHNPDERDPDIFKLRELHGEMDRAVLSAYGWNDIPTECDFFLDYEIDQDEWGDKKKPYRYRWPDEVRDEVLARLLELNAERAKEEALAAEAAEDVAAKTKAGNKSTKKRKSKSANDGQPTLGI